MKYFFFTANQLLAKKALECGVDYVIIDWERRGKDKRQLNKGFEINEDSEEDAKRIANEVGVPICIRINALSEETEEEVRRALDCGAEVVMLPMSQSVDQVQCFLDILGGRAKSLIQIETKHLLEEVVALKNLDWDFTHVGLNDLMLSRNKSNIWESVYDGTVSEICKKLQGRAYGFGGLTTVDGGFPIPAKWIIKKMVADGCSVGILRRSFKSDIIGRDMCDEIAKLRDFIESNKNRNSDEERKDTLHLEKLIGEQLQLGAKP